MAFHKSQFGEFGKNLPCDLNGFVPTEDTGPWDLAYDHGSESTHNSEGSMTEYGQWWEDEWDTKVTDAVVATAEAEKELEKWRSTN